MFCYRILLTTNWTMWLNDYHSVQQPFFSSPSPFSTFLVLFFSYFFPFGNRQWYQWQYPIMAAFSWQLSKQAAVAPLRRAWRSWIRRNKMLTNRIFFPGLKLLTRFSLLSFCSFFALHSRQKKYDYKNLKQHQIIKASSPPKKS